MSGGLKASTFVLVDQERVYVVRSSVQQRNSKWGGITAR